MIRRIATSSIDDLGHFAKQINRFRRARVSGIDRDEMKMEEAMTAVEPLAARARRALAPALIAMMTAMSPLAAGSALADDMFAAMVKVNDAVISGFDIDQRVRLMRLAAPNAEPERLKRRAVEALIGDQLKLQEADRLGLAISDAQVDDAVQAIAQRNRETVEKFLATISSAGITTNSFREQVRADIAWNELIRRRFGERVTPSEGDVDAAMADADTDGAVRYDVRQIVVPLRPDASEERVRRAFEEAGRVRRELNNCAKVAELAPRYSKISGQVGWLTDAQMPPQIAAVVTKLEEGAVSQRPLRSPDGVHVLMLCGKRTAKAASRRNVFERLLQENAARYSDTYLEDLRRTAMIERRK